MTPRRERRSVAVEVMCQPGNMMQRFWVDQVKSICRKGSAGDREEEMGRERKVHSSDISSQSPCPYRRDPSGSGP